MTIEMLVLCLAAFAAPAALLSRPPGVDGPYLVVMAPWSDLAPILARAGAWEIGTETALVGALVTGEGMSLAQRLKDAGALMVFDGSVASWICGERTS
jgi:hypothetical protein